MKHGSDEGYNNLKNWPLNEGERREKIKGRKARKRGEDTW